MNFKALINSLTLSLIFVMGCQSKINEAQPQSVQIKGLSVEKRNDIKKEQDEKLEKIEKAFEKIQNFQKKVQELQGYKTTYTALDLVIDAIKELKNSLPNKEDGIMVRSATLTFDDNKCLHDITLRQNEDETLRPEQYAFDILHKKCDQDKKHIEKLATIFVENEKVEVKINRELHQKIVEQVIAGANLPTQCFVELSNDLLPKMFSCEELQIGRKDNLELVANVLSFEHDKDIPFHAAMTLFENQEKVSTFEVSISKDGKVESKHEFVE